MHFAEDFILKIWSAEIDGHVLMFGKRRACFAKDASPKLPLGAKGQARHVAPSITTTHSGSSGEHVSTTPSKARITPGVSTKMSLCESNNAMPHTTHHSKSFFN